MFTYYYYFKDICRLQASTSQSREAPCRNSYRYAIRAKSNNLTLSCVLTAWTFVYFMNISQDFVITTASTDTNALSFYSSLIARRETVCRINNDPNVILCNMKMKGNVIMVVD